MPNKLFTYADAPDGQLSPPTEYIIPETGEIVLPEETKNLLQKICPLDKITAILKAVGQKNIYLGIGKSADEVAACWAQGHPWLPGLTQIKLKSDHIKIIYAEDAAPITQAALYNEVKKLPGLCRLPGNTTFNSITIKPVWQEPADFKKKFGQNEKFFEGNEYAFKNVNYDYGRIPIDAIIAQFNKILQVKLPDPLPASLTIDRCEPNPLLRGLCAAWYLAEFRYSEPSDPTPKNVKIRIPVGLLYKPVPVEIFKPYPKVTFEAAASNDEKRRTVFTYGLNFRFLCEKAHTESTQKSAKMQFLSNFTFLNSQLKNQGLSIEAPDSLFAPVEKFNTNPRREAWRLAAAGPEKDGFARAIALDVFGRDSLAIFEAGGVHLLKDEKQVAAWCASKQLLENLFYAPPWSDQAAWLNKPLASTFFKGIDWTPESENFPGGREALEDPICVLAGRPEIPGAGPVVSQLASVLGSISQGTWKVNQPAWESAIRLSIKDFRQKTPDEQKTFINNLWDILTCAKEFTRLPAAMYEPTAQDPLTKALSQEIEKRFLPLPTSWRPTDFSNQDFEKRLSASGKWRQFGIGFRIEGEWSELSTTLDRIKINGMTQWRANPDLMAKTSGFYIRGTKLELELDKARFWNGNHDILNQTAVCVSRNFFGATAFPNRDSKGDYVLFALDCSDLPGCDTEKEQLDVYREFKDQLVQYGIEKKDIMRWWRPGEKAFKIIPWDHVIAWVRIQKLGADPEGGWKFKIDAGAKWSDTNPVWRDRCTNMKTDSFFTQKRQYIEEELKAWKGIEVKVPYNFDFVVP